MRKTFFTQPLFGTLQSSESRHSVVMVLHREVPRSWIRRAHLQGSWVFGNCTRPLPSITKSWQEW